MDVILRFDVPKLGRAGQAISVSDGYARNYLFPQAIAEKATKDNMAKIESELRKRSVAEAKEKEACETLAAKLADVSVTIPRKAGEDDKLFGSVTNIDIAKALEKEGITIDRKKILVDPPIRELGVVSVDISLHYDVTATVRVWVVRE